MERNVELSQMQQLHFFQRRSPALPPKKFHILVALDTMGIKQAMVTAVTEVADSPYSTEVCAGRLQEYFATAVPSKCAPVMNCLAHSRGQYVIFEYAT